jgi:hypothetical protein
LTNLKNHFGECKLDVSIVVISTAEELSMVEEELDAFIMENSSNPFILGIFLKAKLKSTPEEYNPKVIIFRVMDKIVGYAPLLLKKRYGFQFASFLFDYWFNPDFVFDQNYYEICIQALLNYIFKSIHCSFADFYLCAESKNVASLDKFCEKMRITTNKKTFDYLNHCAIPVTCSLEDFNKRLSSEKRRQLKVIKRKLESIGVCKIMQFQNGNNEEIALEKIRAIEEKSWKQNWRLGQNLSSDLQLYALLNTTALAAKNYSDFKRSIWFLELDNRAIAYTLVIQYLGTAYIAKTSFDDEYSALSPSILLNNEFISSIFNKKDTRSIDFMTSLPCMHRWKPTQLSRIQLSLRKGYLPKLLSVIKESN